MYIKIYFNNKPLFLCKEIEEPIKPYIHHDDSIFIDELNAHSIKTMIHEMQLEKVHAGVFIHTDLNELKKEFFRKFTLVTAAGGLVTNEKDEVLMIFRRGKWDLPKGKLDKGETLEACAVREVEEETGLTNITRGELLITTYHTYHEGSHFILKDSHWFDMKVTGNQQLIPQTEEDIHEIRWVKPEDLEKYFKDCFPSVADVLKHHLAY